jgi:hypothetical protein
MYDMIEIPVMTDDLKRTIYIEPYSIEIIEPIDNDTCCFQTGTLRQFVAAMSAPALRKARTEALMREYDFEYEDQV